MLVLSGCTIEVGGGLTPEEVDQGASTTTPTTIQSTTTPVATVLPVTKPVLSEEEKNLLASWENKIYPKTLIGEIDVSGLTVEEAKEKVENDLMEPLKDRRVRFSYANKKNYMSYNKLKVAIDESIYEKALARGKDANDEEKLKLIKEGNDFVLEPALIFDEDHVASIMDDMQTNLTALSRQFSAYRKDGRVLLKEDATEDELDREAFMAEIRKAVNFSAKNNKYIEAPVKKIPVKITQEELDRINKRISQSSTNYGWSYDARAYNVELAAEMISGSLIMPGQEFSFNQTIGGGAGSTNGFQKSGVYIGLEMVEEPGGGVCQVSSTIYNVLLNLGIDPTQRQNHGMTVGYVQPGLDAVIYAPSLDLRFKNPFDDPIFITAKADGDQLRFNVYGAEDALGGYTYKYDSEVYEVDEAEIKEMDDPTIPKGGVVLDPTPKDGSKVRVYKITLKDGEQVSRKLYTDNSYRRSDGVRRIGTGEGNQVNEDWYVDRKVLKYPKGFKK